ncbi:MAG: hypothetical protein PUA77_05750 [Lachnospiraceae bacterium]|nr:hypothetical protein [Lachnospiraceae bacterium]
MNWMDKLEKKLGRYAVPNLSRYFIVAIVTGFLLELAFPTLLSYLSFSVSGILHGQIWRLVTWVFIPATSLDIFGILFLVCVLSWGSSLESFLGTFRMNVFLIGGIVLSDIAGILVYVISLIATGTGMSVSLSLYYILISILWALALCMPEGEVRLYFILPIKMKWMLVFELAYLGYQVVRIFAFYISTVGAGLGVVYGLVSCTDMIVAVVNMFLFFWFASIHISRKQKKRQKQFRAQFSEPRPGSGISKHKCAICGRTDLTNPELSFRYCSKCIGNREYCEEHLFTHRHVV